MNNNSFIQVPGDDDAYMARMFREVALAEEAGWDAEDEQAYQDEIEQAARDADRLEMDREGMFHPGMEGPGGYNT